MLAPDVAVLGATSHLAQDFVAEAAKRGDHRLHLYARRPEVAEAGLAARGVNAEFPVSLLESFGTREHSAVINFIGVGDPARAAALGAGIFDVTRHWDGLVLDYLRGHPEAAYLFLSSGAVYGNAFDEPVTSTTSARYPVNNLGPQNWYALAKLCAEAAHRSEPGKTIVDVRIFNYFSRSVDPAARFLVTDMLRCARSGEIFRTDDQPVVRDYLEPKGLYALLSACISAPIGTNQAVDAYTLAPIAKNELLDLMARKFGLRFEVGSRPPASNPTGAKPHYHSRNHAAADLGYRPVFTSAEAIVNEARAMIAGARQH